MYRNSKASERKNKQNEKPSHKQAYQENYTHSSEGHDSSVKKSNDDLQEILLVPLCSSHSSQREPDKKRQHARIRPPICPYLFKAVVSPPHSQLSYLPRMLCGTRDKSGTPSSCLQTCLLVKKMQVKQLKLLK